MLIERLRAWIASSRRLWIVSVACVVIIVAVGMTIVGGGLWGASDPRSTNETTVSNATFPTPTPTAAVPTTTDDATVTTRNESAASSVSVPPNRSAPHPPGVGSGGWSETVGGTQSPAAADGPVVVVTGTSLVLP